MENLLEDNDDGRTRNRTDPRQSMLLQSALRRPHDPAEFPIRIRNLSTGGLMADCMAAFEVGEAVWVFVRGVGTAVGTIAWYRPGQLGIQFDMAIDPGQARKPVTARSEAMILPPVLDGWRPGFQIK